MRTTSLIILAAIAFVLLAPAQQATSPEAPQSPEQQAAQEAARQVAQQAAQPDTPPATPNGLPPALVPAVPAKPAAKGDTVPIFTSNTYLVILNVSATDKAGNSIPNLKKEDFTITEDGKKQDIAVFDYQDISTEPEPPEEIKLTDELKLPETPKKEISSPTPGDLLQRQAADGILFRLLFHADSRAVARSGRRARLSEEVHH